MSTATTEIKVKDGGNPTRNRELLENAIDLASKSRVVRPIVIPSLNGGFVVDRPVFAFGPNLDIRGANPETVLSCRWQSPPLIIGINPEPGCHDGKLPAGPRKWNGDHWRNGGIATFGADGLPDTVYAFPASPFTNPLGASYRDLPGFELELDYDPHDAPIGFQILGLAEAGWGKPWYLHTWRPDANTPPVHVVVFATEKEGEPNGVRRSFSFPISEKSGPRSFKVRVDLVKGAISATSAGKAVPINGAGLGDDWKPGLRFVDSGIATFKLGGLGLMVDAWQDNQGGPARYTFRRCELSTLEGKGIARLDLAEPIKDARLIRWVSSVPESCAGFGLALLGGNHTHPFNTATKVRLSSLDLQSGGPVSYPFGAGIWAGGTLQGFTFERVTFQGGQDQYGGLMAGAAYPLLFRDCTFGPESGFPGNGLTARIATMKFEGQTTIRKPGKNGMVLVGCVADINGLLVTESRASCETFLSILKGGIIRLCMPMGDTEETKSPTKALVYVQRNVWGDFPQTVLNVDGGVMDGGAEGVPIFDFDDTSDEPGFPTVFEVKNFSSWKARLGPTIRTNGPMTTGNVVGTIGTTKDEAASAKAGSLIRKPAPATRLHVDRFGKAGAIEGAE